VAAQRLNGLVSLDDLALKETARQLDAGQYYQRLRDALDALGLAGAGQLSQASVTQLRLAEIAAPRWNRDQFATFLQGQQQFTWSASDSAILGRVQALANLGMPSRAQRLSADAFRTQLQSALRDLQVLGRLDNLDATAAQAAQTAATTHGNTGRSPYLVFNPNANNPYPAGTRYYGYFERIRALGNAGVPAAAVMMRSLAHPTQRFGVPFQLDRAEYYRDPSRNQLVGIEVATTSVQGNGYVDLMLTGNTAIDCKDWTGFSSKPRDVQIRMIEGLVTAAEKYLASANVTTMIFEFRGSVPTLAAAALRAIAAPAGKSLQCNAIP
jgi:hypothetical protein